MRISKSEARKAAYFFLTLLGGAFLAILIYTIYEKVGPKTIEVENVPFGLSAGSFIFVGEAPDTSSGLSSMPASTRQELKRASDLAVNGKYLDASEVFEAIALQYPDAFAAEWGAAKSLLSIDSLSPQKESELNFVVKALKARFPQAAVSFYLDSRMAQKAGDMSSALELSRLAKEKAPSMADVRLLYAKLLFSEGRYIESIEEGRAAISLSLGNIPEPYVLLAKTYHDQGVLDTCSLVVEYALSKFPASPELLCLQGYLLEYKGKFDDAENIYRRILAIHPDFKAADDAIQSLGEKSPPGKISSPTRLSPKDRAQVAYDILEPLVNQYPENLPLREALGRAYLKGRDFSMAKSEFIEIQNRDPDYPDIQLRLQEASAVPSPSMRDDLLANNLNRVIDSMRTLPTSEHSFETSLGHYLVRYGATTKEFFSKYSVANFKKLSDNAWRESFYEAPYFHQYTALFDEKGLFYGVHVVVTDSNVVAGNSSARLPEVYKQMLQLNSRISGIGTETGETDCDGTVIEGAVWESRDNFEMLARVTGKPSEVRMIRLDRSKIPDGTRLCGYLPYLSKY